MGVVVESRQKYKVASTGINCLSVCRKKKLPKASTPCPEKNGTNNVLGITLTKFNKFSQFLAQFMLTYQLTKKL